jgi:hypothetical protein
MRVRILARLKYWESGSPKGQDKMKTIPLKRNVCLLVDANQGGGAAMLRIACTCEILGAQITG